MYYGCTSGSTGDPKICVYTNKQFSGNSEGVVKTAVEIDKVIRTLTFASFYTTTGHIILGTLILFGYYHVLMDRFEPKKIFKLIEKERITKIDGASSAFLALIHHPSRPNCFPGELEFRSGIMMKEYLDNSEANQSSFTEDRWFKSGDEAVMKKKRFPQNYGKN